MDTSKKKKELFTTVSEVSVNKNPKRLNQSREKEMYQTVKVTCCLRERAELV